MGGFLLGYMLGFLTVIAVAVLVLWLLLRGASRGAVAKFLEGASMAMGEAGSTEDTDAEASRPLPGDGALAESPAGPERNAFAGLVQEGGYGGHAGTENGKRGKSR